ncbi:MAG: ATP-binding cassette domain-containing protein [Desulfobacteraceae bacterium]|nr:ATP-binding cassette domain-containing protein [Desulfobacteraceae bacterium]
MVRQLTSEYGDQVILDKVSFDVHKGEILVILGGSGCGKTTLLRHMVGLNKTHKGSIHIEGHDICNGDDSIYQAALKKIGILFQNGALLGSMTVSENVALPIIENARLSKQALKRLVRMKLTMVGLGEYGHYLPSELSGGMRKRAALARALALNPEILFLDEPSAGLDPITSAEIDDLILMINRNIGTTMVIVTHELASIFALAKRVIMLDKSVKGIIADGEPHHLKQHSDNPLVRQFFNRESRNQAI